MGTPKIKTEMKMPNLQVRADFQPNSFDSKNLTIDCVMSSGYRGQRSDWMTGACYMEELDLSSQAIRTDRLDKGLPVLTNHAQSPNLGSEKLMANVGIVTSYRLENGNLIGTIKMSRTEECASLVQDIQDGIVRSVSLGYRVYRYLDVTTPTDDMQVLRAVDWEPLEMSFVSIPFDPNSQTRNAQSMNSVQIENKKTEGEIMGDQNRSAEETPKAVEEKREEIPAPAAKEAEEKKEEVPAAEEKKEEPAAEVKPSEEEVRSLERVRSSTIVECVRKAGLEQKFAEELIKKDITVDAARALIIDALAERGGKPLSNKTEIKVGEDLKIETQKRGIVNAILHRSNSKIALTEEGRQFRGMRMHQIAAELLETAGVKTRGLTPNEIASKALSHDFHIRSGEMGSGDFANLMADVANKTLRQAYDESPQSFLPFVRKVTAPDFKNISRVQLGEFANLAKVNQHGDLQYGSISDSKETYQVASYAKGLRLTKQAIVNDDLDGLSRMAMLMGRAASRLESDLVYAILLANANMGDAVALFHSSHGNLGTSGVIGETSLTEMRKLGRKQSGLDTAKLNIVYKHLIVSPELEIAAVKQISAIVPNQSSVVNPFVGQFNIIVDPRVSGGTSVPSQAGTATQWFAAADPTEIDTIEVAYLEGQAGPMIVEDVDFDSQGIKMAVWHDVGVKAIDYRGLFKNAGA